ncbi:MAG TPA: bifunctional diguanylate cyclase/phosphodiesterase [Anaeromyxobacteraceae bacterium]|nr:bifunctional diguanylate cyclase/phosphodiesterase [Anaeromyxobacteraceae bacterium]
MSPDLPAELRREMDDLAARLSASPEQARRLDRLVDLLRRRLAPAHAPWAERDAFEREVAGLLGEMEREERARLRRVDEETRAAARTVALGGASAGIAAAALVLLALGRSQWEIARRRRTARSVVRLLARQRRLAQRIDYLDHHDPLTGCPNRQRLVEMLEQEIARAKEASRAVSVLVLDVNRLRHVNDLFGAEVGDRLLQEIARRLKAQVGRHDIVARFTGGEFAVVLLGPPGPAAAVARAEQMQRALAESIPVGEHGFVVTSNFGVAAYPVHGRDARSLLRSAELALGRAISLGRNVTQVFEDGIDRGVSERFFLEKRLSGALRSGEYLVHYQPWCDLATSAVTGAEALVKWRDADLGMVPASRFVPLLEDTGMIVDVGRWVLETACGQISRWQRGERPLPVSVNLSLIQFRDKQLVDRVAAAIDAFKLDPRNLALEVTESVCLQDMEFAIRTLRRLKDMGVSLSVDDFGTGYSSLSYLKKLPIDSVKIDISFVRDVATDPDTASIVTAITSLARGLSLKTVAEGVETEDQRRILHLLRCDMGQGFLFSPAVTAADLERFATEGRRPPAELARSAS